MLFQQINLLSKSLEECGKAGEKERERVAGPKAANRFLKDGQQYKYGFR